MAQEGTLVGTRLGDFELRSVLGVGGMAEVYRARDVMLEREVAVKVLPATLAQDAGYVERFRNEARQVAALNHPHIVPIYTFGDDTERGLLYHVMPLLGESLRDRLSRERALSPEEAVAYVLQVAAALEAAHAIGLVHRDVKPENILLDADGQAMLTDFGIARPVASLRQSGVARTLAATGLPVGTPEYMAPEQLRGESTDQRADIYALGAVLYELLTGRVPYEAETPYGVAALVISSELIPPSQHEPRIWPALDRVVTRALAKDPARRYADAPGFAAALTAAMAHAYDTADAEATAPVAALSPAAAGDADAATTLSGAWATPPRARRTLSRRALLAVGLLSVLLMVGVAGGIGLLLRGINPPGMPTASNGDALFGGTTQATDTVPVSGTSTSAGSPHGATPPGTTPGTGPGGGPGLPPGAPPGATPLPTSTGPGNGQPTPVPPPGATPTATATSTPVPVPTATPVPGPSMTVSPSSTFTLDQYQFNSTCYGSQKMTNNGTSGQTLNWSWQVSPAPSGMHYSINAFPYPSGTPGTPSQSNMPAGQQETLWVSMPCNGQTYNVKLTYNGSGSPINFQMVVP